MQIIKKQLGVSFGLPNSSWALGLTWRMVDRPSETPLVKNDFTFPGSYQLQIAFWLQVELCVYFLLFSARVLSGLNTFRP